MPGIRGRCLWNTESLNRRARGLWTFSPAERAPARAGTRPVDAVGLIQGRMIEMVCAADVAEKAVGVTVEDIRGNCPQNMILLAIFGDTASVEAAMDEIRRREKEGREEW